MNATGAKISLQPIEELCHENLICLISFQHTSHELMAVSIGKRKRHESENESNISSEDEGAVRARFQQAFEAKFKPLERSTPFSLSEEPSDQDESERSSDKSDWDGLSDGEGHLEIIDHEGGHSKNQDQQNQERKTFMVCKWALMH